MLTIFNFARGARGVRVAWLCEEMGVSYRVELISFPTPEPYRARNPLGKVPFLDDNGTAITESIAMLLHVADAHGPTPLLPAAGDRSRARCLEMAIFAEATLGSQINALLIDHFAVPDGKRDGALAQMLKTRVEQAIGYVDHVLGERRWLADDAFSIADIAISTSFVMWCGPLAGELPPRLAAYQERCLARPAYQRANGANQSTAK